jgi:hypothetical protein
MEYIFISLDPVIASMDDLHPFWAEARGKDEIQTMPAFGICNCRPSKRYNPMG